MGLTFLRRHRAALASTVVLAAVAGTVTGLALSAHGYPARHVELNDGGIWVTSDKDGLYGRLNRPAGALDLALNPPGGAQQAYQLDVRQEDAAVVSWDQASGKLYPVDVTAGSTLADQGIPVSSGEQVDIGGGTLAVLDPATGRVWAMRVDTTTGLTSLAGLDPDTAKPVARFRSGAVAGGTSRAAGLAVGADGRVYAVTDSGQVAVSVPRADGSFATTYSRLDHPLQSVQVSAVGDHLVVLDAKAGSVLLPGGRQVSVPASPETALQQPSSAGPAVVLATPTRLLSVPLGGGSPATLFDHGSGAPAAPTWLQNCVYAAWAGSPGVYARSCDGEPARPGDLQDQKQLVDPVFRVNRGAIMLNDLTTGAVYDLQSMHEVDDWSAAKPPPIEKPSRHTKNSTGAASARDLPPKAADVTLGARPGRTTVLHLLDYDSDPQGYILAISAVGPPDEPGATLSIAPDAQTVEIAMPATGHDVHFRYTIDDGKGLSASAEVTVVQRLPGQNVLPALRPRFVQPAYSVASGGSLTVPVLGDWRDFDGDPVVLVSATASAGTVTTTPSGSLTYIAPADAGPQKITYRVSDGIGTPVAHEVPVTVLAATTTKTVAPVAEPDVARGETGKPIVITPLANDLPGVDPADPTATLHLAGDVPSPAGTTVASDLRTGTVTFTASRKGTYLLSYTAAFGAASFARGTVRVDVVDPPPTAQPPITVPATAALYGQAPATVDVLAGDFDPSGGVLVVQHAAPVTPNNQLQVAIVGGRWLRITALAPTLAPSTQLVDYTVTDGVTAPVTGQVTVTQLPTPVDDTPVTVPAYATVRAGDSTLVPVLTHDIDPDGAPLALLPDVRGAPAPGRLTVTASSGAPAGAGAAFVAGDEVRYVAPARVPAPQTVQISYVTVNPSGDEATGLAIVTINPAPSATDPDRAPVPQDVTVRMVAGDTVSIPIRTTGIDPDGDTATVTGIGSAPRLGRVLAVGATAITYQALPTGSGTDTFTYQVADAYGMTGTATIRVGVVPPGQPQPPVAVDESVTAAPHSRLHVDVLSNAIVAPDDKVTITPLSRTNPELTGASLAGPSGPIVVDTGAASSRPTVIVYSISDGIGSPSVATLTVHTQDGYVTPPIASDDVAAPKPTARSVTVPVLANDSDPSGSPLHIATVFDARALVRGPSVVVPVLGHAQNIAYEVEDGSGATAAAVVHVPAAGSGAPQAIPNRLISVPENGSRTIDIADYVTDPRGRAVRLTTANQLVPTPVRGLRLTSPSDTRLTLTGLAGYVGPAAITFQVTDGRSLSDPTGQLAVVTVPVQVGPDTPVLRCPSDPIQVVEGGRSQRLDVATLCHVWTSDPAQVSSLDFTASWAHQPGGVAVTGAGTHVLTLTASGAARPGAVGTLSVGVAGTRAIPATLTVTVLPLGPPTVAPITIDGFKAGATATRDVAGFVSSPLRDPVITVVGLTQESGMPARAVFHGATISITPGATSHGPMTFTLVVTDVADTARTDRRATGRVTLDVLNVPDAPPAPVPGRTQLSRVVQLSWGTPAGNGAPIDSYQVTWPGGSQICPASPCSITGLTNGHAYQFAVRAHNAVGYGRPSPRSAPATPDALPGAARNVTVSDPQDGSVLVSWAPAPDIGSAIVDYVVTWSGGGRSVVPGGVHATRARPLVNDDVYTFTVVAVNRKGDGPPASASGQSAGTPAAPTGVTAQYASAAGTTQRAVIVSWNPVDPNGPRPTTYTVTRNGTPICTHVQATSCDDTPNSGATYTYDVTAANADGRTSAPGTAQIAVAGTPDTIAGMSATHNATDGELVVSFTMPASNGATSTIKCSTSAGACGPFPGGQPGSPATETITGLPYDQDVTVTLQDCNEQQCGATTSATGHTDGPPNGPVGLSCSLNGQTITWGWGAPAPINGYAVHFQLTGVVTIQSTTQTSYSQTFPADGNQHTLTVTSWDSRNERGGSASATCTDKSTPPPPPQTVTVRMGAYTTAPTCTAGCHFIQVTLQNFAPNTTYQVYAQAGHPFSGQTGLLVMKTNGSGYYSGQPGPYYGYPDYVTVTVNGHSGTCSGNWGSPTGTCG